MCRYFRAYPRQRGGTRMRLTGLPAASGLSPPARGNLVQKFYRLRITRPIPASAGEPLMPSLIASPPRAYPRQRGGTWIGL